VGFLKNLIVKKVNFWSTFGVFKVKIWGLRKIFQFLCRKIRQNFGFKVKLYPNFDNWFFSSKYFSCFTNKSVQILILKSKFWVLARNILVFWQKKCQHFGFNSKKGQNLSNFGFFKSKF